MPSAGIGVMLMWVVSVFGGSCETAWSGQSRFFEQMQNGLSPKFHEEADVCRRTEMEALRRLKSELNAVEG